MYMYEIKQKQSHLGRYAINHSIRQKGRRQEMTSQFRVTPADTVPRDVRFLKANKSAKVRVVLPRLCNHITGRACDKQIAGPHPEFLTQLVMLILLVQQPHFRTMPLSGIQTLDQGFSIFNMSLNPFGTL